MPRSRHGQTSTNNESLGFEFSARAFRFAEEAQDCPDMLQLADLTQEAASIIGMTAVASGVVSGPERIHGNLFHFENWPAEWLELYISRGYVDIDPVPRWAVVSGAPISWSQLLRTLAADDPGHEVYSNASKRGFTEGFVTPARCMDGSLGLVSVGGNRGELLSWEGLYLQSVSVNAFHRAEAIRRSTSLSAGSGSLSLASLESDMDRGQQETSEAKLRALFALTAAEWRVAYALYCGESLQGMAATSKLSINTLRVQLGSVYSKTRTHKQIELVAAIRSALSSD